MPPAVVYNAFTWEKLRTYRLRDENTTIIAFPPIRLFLQTELCTGVHYFGQSGS